LGFRNLLVVTQVAVSTLLLIASGLFLRSLASAGRIETGLHARNVLWLAVDPIQNSYSPERARTFLETVAARVSSLPGVRSVSYTNVVPLSSVGSNTRFAPDHRRSEPLENRIRTHVTMVGPRFFETLEISWLRGQDFSAEGPNSEPVVIINEAFAREAFPGQDPIGRRIYEGINGYRVIGIAATTKARTIDEEPVPQVYHPVSQKIGQGEASMMGLSLAVKTEGEPATWTQAVRKEIAALDPALAIFDVRTMENHLHNALLMPRLAAFLFGLCGGMGLLIATIGLYGVVSFAVARRTKEIGIRMALGAQRGEILAMVLRSGLGLTIVGIVIGGGLALPATRAARTLLYGVSPSDPLTYVVIPLFLMLVATVASLIPARRAARLDPLTTLRYE
jgi:predicted permease